jgi:hypothetical protein
VNNVQLDTAEGEFVSVLSENGMFIRTLKPNQPASSVNVQITIEDRNIKLESVVLYCHKFEEGLYREPGMGLQFTRIASRDKSMIQQFIIEEINRGIKAF